MSRKDKVVPRLEEEDPIGNRVRFEELDEHGRPIRIASISAAVHNEGDIEPWRRSLNLGVGQIEILKC